MATGGSSEPKLEPKQEPEPKPSLEPTAWRPHEAVNENHQVPLTNGVKRPQEPLKPPLAVPTNFEERKPLNTNITHEMQVFFNFLILFSQFSSFLLFSFEGLFYVPQYIFLYDFRTQTQFV